MITLNRCPLCESGELERERTCVSRFSDDAFTLDRCKHCGFLFTNPAPDDTWMHAFYETLPYAPHLGQAPNRVETLASLVRPSAMRMRARMLEQTPKTSGRRFLDIGCGIGTLAATMKRRGWDVVAIEPSERARATGKELHGLEIRDTDALAIDQKPFDVIVLWHALEHIRDLHGTLATIERLTVPGSTVIIAVPNHRSLDGTFYGDAWMGYDVPLHYWHFDPVTMARLAALHNLRIVRTRSQPGMAMILSLGSENSGILSATRGLVIGMLSALWGLLRSEEGSCIVYTLERR